MANRPTNADIMKELGKLQAGLEGLHKEMGDAKSSRKVMYDRINDQNNKIAEIGFQVEIAVKTSEETKKSAEKVHLELYPLLSMKDDLPNMVQGWRELNRTSKRLLWLLAVGGASVVGAAIWFGDLVTTWVRAWLNIQPPPGP